MEFLFQIKVKNGNVVENALIDTIESLRKFFYKISKISIINGTIKVKEEKDQNSKLHYSMYTRFIVYENLVKKTVFRKLAYETKTF